MSKLVWDQVGEKLFETGVEKGVVYPLNSTTKAYDSGYSWNGLTKVSESPSGAEATKLWADNINYLNLYSAEEFGATVEAYMYPDEFADLDGTAEVAPGVRISQQTRKTFGMSYVTKIGNDVDGNDHGEKIHLIYGAMASPSAKEYDTINDSPNAITFSWTLTTTPVPVKGFKPTASLTIDTTKCDPDKLETFKDIIYGTESAEPRLPLPDEVASLLGTAPSNP